MPILQVYHSEIMMQHLLEIIERNPSLRGMSLDNACKEYLSECYKKTLGVKETSGVKKTDLKLNF